MRFRSGATFAFQVSDTLDSLLVRQGYNKQMRPENRPGQPVEVSLNLAIRNIGPIDELKAGGNMLQSNELIMGRKMGVLRKK